MIQYYLLITSVNCLVLLIMCGFVASSTSLKPYQKHGFSVAFILIILISILEALTLWVDGKPASYRWLNLFSNFLGFTLTPLLPLAISYAIGKKRLMKVELWMYIIYVGIFVLTMPFGLIFNVNQNNVYSRGPCFGFYVLNNVVSILYLLWVTLQMTAQFQNKGRHLLYPILFLTLFGTTIQVVLPHIYVTWLFISFLTILHYVYCNELWYQLDGLTALLSQRSYLSHINEVKKTVLVLIIDIDNFKGINDKYGHALGDECLITVAQCILHSYGRKGYCYRIGGDEFCVIMEDITNLDVYHEKFETLMTKERQNFIYLPTVSIGEAVVNPGEVIHEVLGRADKNMYSNKSSKNQID